MTISQYGLDMGCDGNPGANRTVINSLPAQIDPDPGFTPHSEVPWAFRKAAKAFRDRVIAADQAMSVITDELNAYTGKVLARRSTWRREHIDHVIRRWQDIPQVFRCGLAMQRDKQSLTIADCRIVASNFRFDAWQNDIMEDAVSLYVLQFTMQPAKQFYKPLVLATISNHAIGRRLQRGFDNSDAGVTVDISELALNVSNLIKQEQDNFHLQCRHGTWRGNVVKATTTAGQQLLLAVRSYV